MMTNKNMYSSYSLISVTLTIALFTLCNSQNGANYFGKFIGSLKQYQHSLQGDVYAVDSRTIHIRNFNYDGEGPAGYFYVSNGKSPSDSGIKLRDERGSSAPLKRYRKKHITLTLPEGKTINNIKWFYVWCDEFAVNFGDVKIPKNLDFPKPQKIGKLSGVHGVSSDNIVIVDAQTLLIPAFSYDGEAPDAKFWVGAGSKPTPQGIRVPDENGKTEPLRKYDKKTIVLTLPSDITVFDIGNFAIWCEAFTVDFGHVEMDKDVLNVPPSLKMLGVSPQSKLNCEILYDDLAFEARWAVAGDSIVIQLVAKLEKGEYMSFGISGQIDRNTMVGGDVVVAWIDHETLNGFAYDYYLDSKSQCAGSRGSCPDIKLRANTESIRLLNAALVNGYSIVTYQRPLRAHDELDLPIFTNGTQAVIWAIGPLNSLQEVSYHKITSKRTTLIDFGRSPQWNCPIPESDASIANSETNENYESSTLVPSTEPTRIRPESTAVRTRRPTSDAKESETIRATTKRVEATPAPVKREKPWDIPPIQCYEPEDGIFYAQMGPTGGKRGYSAITGHVGWGLSWYINGLLIPEINVVRGRTYTFVTEGGFDPEIPAKYHPFYITDDPVGGFHYKTPEERAKVRVFAGVMQTNKPGEYVPTGVGRLCSWTPDPEQPPADEFASFGAYQRTLSLVCDQGEPGVVQWTPDENTPDTVYYQCFTHRYLGWKINVHDTCDKEEAASSEQISSRVRIDDDNSGEQVEGELESRPSIQVVTRVKPTNVTSVGNEIPGMSQENANVYYSSPMYKDAYKSSDYSKTEQQLDYSKTEQLILQDPYMPPPPYQKNFDYQTMQTTEPMKEIKSTMINEKNSDLVMDFTKPVKAYMPHFTTNFNGTVHPTLMTSKLKTPYSHRDPYPVYKTPLPLPGSSKHYGPAMHIHVIKHADHAPEMMAAPSQKSFVVGRPHRHSMMMKKPITKPIPFGYAPRATKVPKLEPQVSSSMAVKNILAPPLRDTIPKAPQGMLVSYYSPPQQPQQPKKAYYVPSRKREEPKPQYFAGKVEEYAEPKNNGFNPNSIVIEGGFKPIIPSTESQQHVVAQERMSEDNEEYVEQDLKEIVSSSTENTTKAIIKPVVDEHSKNPFEGKQPELFEPIFIPSPVISEEQRKKKPQERPAIEGGHKVDPNIVYIWPAAGVETPGPPQMKDTRFNGYFSSANTIPSPFYKGPTEKSEGGSSINENVVDAAYSPILSKPVGDATHEYKVTEIFDNFNAEVNETNNATDRIISLSSDEVVEDDQKADTHKVKYIPVSYATGDENDNKFIITIPDEESTESVNSTIIKL